MAHNPTRIEGFEGGSLTFMDAVLGAPTIIAAAARSGDYGLRITAPVGAGTCAVTLASRFDPNIGGAADLATDIFATAPRLYVRFASLPAAGTTAEFAAVRASTGASVARLDVNSGGHVLLNGTVGATVLAVGQWYRLEALIDPLTLTRLRIGGVLELGDGAPAPTNRLTIGKTGIAGGIGGYTADFDDIVIESDDTDAANIDYPGSGRILRLDVDGDGFYDGLWTSTTDPNAYQSVGVPDNGDVDRILSTLISLTNQTCMLESTAAAGIAAPIGAAQYSAVAKFVAGGDSGIELIARSGIVNQVLTAPTLIGAVYTPYSHCMALSPFTVAPWTLAGLDSLEVGLGTASIV